MIYVTRLNHTPVVLNSELIEQVETTPDTVISLTTGQKLMVLESPGEIIDRVIELPTVDFRPGCGGWNWRKFSGKHKPWRLKENPVEMSPDLATIGGLVVGGRRDPGRPHHGKREDPGCPTVHGRTDRDRRHSGSLHGDHARSVVLLRAFGKISAVFFSRTQSTDAIIEEIIQYATQARKQGIVSLEQQAASIQDPFMRKALNLAVDGIDMGQIKSIMELEISLMEQDRGSRSEGLRTRRAVMPPPSASSARSSA